VYLVLKGAKLESPNKDGLTALHHASYKGHICAAEWLIKKGCNIEARSLKGNTPLIMAARNGLTQTCRTLIENGADPNARNKDGETAYDVAKKSNKIKTYKLLANSLGQPDRKSTNNFKQVLPSQLLRPGGKLSQTHVENNKLFGSPNPGLMAARSAQLATVAVSR